MLLSIALAPGCRSATPQATATQPAQPEPAPEAPPAAAPARSERGPALLDLTRAAADDVAPASIGAPADDLQPPTLQAQGEAAALEQSAAAQSGGLAIDGSLRTWYRGRFSSDDDDNDLYASLYMDIGDETRDPVTLRFSGYMAWDVDGEAAGDDPFFELSDTYDRPYFRLYELFGDLHRIDGLEHLRVGRQMSWTTPVLTWFDGVSVETEQKGEQQVAFGAYGGLPVRTYRPSSTYGDDALFGAHGEFRPWAPTRLRLDYLHLEDETVSPDGRDDLWTLQLWQAAGERMNLFGSTSLLEGDSRDYRLRTAWADYEHELTLQATWYELLQTQSALPLEIDPFYEQLQDWFPFRSLQLLASKGIVDWLSLQGGLDARRVSAEDDVGEFNRDFDRWFVTAILDGEPSKALHDFDLSLTYESWSGGGEDIGTWGADLGLERGRTRASIGNYFALYKFDVVQGEEREDVYTYYLRFVRELGASTKADLRYEYEDSDLDDYHTLRLGVTWQF
jgi:hypothetical protein